MAKNKDVVAYKENKMNDKPTFKRLQHVPEPLESPRTKVKEPKGMCPICGRDLKSGTEKDVHTGMCKVMMDKGSFFQGGKTVLSEATKETIKRIYEKHVIGL